MVRVRLTVLYRLRRRLGMHYNHIESEGFNDDSVDYVNGK